MTKVSWAERRKMGVLRFIFVYGVLTFGLPFFLLFCIGFSILLAVAEGKHFLDFVSTAGIPMLIVSLLGGAAFGGWYWSAAEREFLDQTQD